LVRFLTEIIGLPSGKKYGKLKIPSLFKDNDLFVASFIRGLADTDFSLMFKKGSKKNPYYPVIVGVSKSESFMREVMNQLKIFGFSMYFEKRTYYDKRVEKNITTYRIYLNGEKQLALWNSKIGFEHPKNLNKLNIHEKRKKTKIARDGIPE